MAVSLYLKPEDFNHSAKAIYLLIWFGLMLFIFGLQTKLLMKKNRKKRYADILVLVIVELLILVLAALIIFNLAIKVG